jgi:hypothetical protein
MAEQIGLHPERHVGAIHIFLPNYQARIKRLTLGAERLSLGVETAQWPLEQLLGKLHVKESIGTRTFHADVEFTESIEVIPIGFPLGEVHAQLFSRGSGELIDFRNFRQGGRGFDEDVDDVEFERTTEEEIEALIARGENHEIEFKAKLGNGMELVESVVAFSNGKGGIILIGVDNRGNVVGCDQQQMENTVRNLVRTHCEQAVDPQVTEAEVRGKLLLAIRVREGNNKPYTLRERGVIVRAGSTDRVATREEIDSFYRSDDNSPFLSR